LFGVGFLGPGDREFLHAELDGVLVSFHVEIDLVLLSVVHPVHDDSFADAFDVDFLSAGQADLFQVPRDRDDPGLDLVTPGADVRGGVGLLRECIVGGGSDDPGKLAAFLLGRFLLLGYMDLGLLLRRPL